MEEVAKSVRSQAARLLEQRNATYSMYKVGLPTEARTGPVHAGADRGTFLHFRTGSAHTHVPADGPPALLETWCGQGPPADRACPRWWRRKRGQGPPADRASPRTGLARAGGGGGVDRARPRTGPARAGGGGGVDRARPRLAGRGVSRQPNMRQVSSKLKCATLERVPCRRTRKTLPCLAGSSSWL